MKDIKFRGFKKAVSEWVYGYFYIHQRGGNTLDVYNIISIEDGNTYSVRPETVGQYIGLKDKNKKEIYKGDILKNPHRTGVVIWKESMSAFIMNPLSGECDCEMYGFDIMPEGNILKDTEVIGNKFDNPELLKETK